LLVLVDETAEVVLTTDCSEVLLLGTRDRQLGPEPPEGPGMVVVPEVPGEHRLELLARNYEEVVETVLADGPHLRSAKALAYAFNYARS
jgi:hypothetical protein